VSVQSARERGCSALWSASAEERCSDVNRGHRNNESSYALARQRVKLGAKSRTKVSKGLKIEELDVQEWK